MGKCSLTVALPIISAMGVETCVIPTAVLSAHTAFDDFSFCDLTEEVARVADMWKKQGEKFSCIYTGYLGSLRQLDIVSDFIDTFGDKATVFIDPVMGDFGRLYSGFDADFAKKMAELCRKAHIIVPNITEARLLLGEEFREAESEEEIHDILRRLSALGPKYVVLTGVVPKEGMMGAVMYDSENDAFYSHYAHRVSKTFHGTGDIFASSFVGGVCRGMPLSDALSLAVDFTAECARRTLCDPDAPWYGVNFEEAIPYLCERIK